MENDEKYGKIKGFWGKYKVFRILRVLRFPMFAEFPYFPTSVSSELPPVLVCSNAHKFLSHSASWTGQQTGINRAKLLVAGLLFLLTLKGY